MKPINKDLLWITVNRNYYNSSDYLTMVYKECLDILTNGLMQKPLESNYDNIDDYKADIMVYNLKSKFHQLLVSNGFIEQ